MKILLTGAAGYLGRAVRKQLDGRHTLRLFDVQPVESLHESVAGDLLAPHQIDRAAKGVDVIVHTAWLSPGSLRRRSETDFFELNMRGTLSVLRAARRHNVGKVVVCGSLAADDAEYLWSGPAGWTARAAEEMCRYYHKQHGITCLFLRMGDFNRYRDYVAYGMRLLRRGVDRRDAARAAVLAAESTFTGFASPTIASSHRLGESDKDAYHADPAGALAKHYPDSADLLEELPLPDDFLKFDLAEAAETIGYEPRYTFGAFLQGLREKLKLESAS